MSNLKSTTDFIGQTITIGDWAAITQKNEMMVGRVVSVGTNTITIARNKYEEFQMTDAGYKKLITLNWRVHDRNKQVETYFKAKFPNYTQPIPYYTYGLPKWVRDKKFVKINPTDQMKFDYDK